MGIISWIILGLPASTVARGRQDAGDDGALAEIPDNDLVLRDDRRVQDRRRLWVRRSRGRSEVPHEHHPFLAW